MADRLSVSLNAVALSPAGSEGFRGQVRLNLEAS